MRKLGLSIEMGAFIAGVALAQLPYSTELRERIVSLTELEHRTDADYCRLADDITALR